MSCLLNRQPTKTLDEISGFSGYFREIGDAVERIAVCQDEEQLVGLLRETTALLGASASYFVTFLREDRSFDSYNLLLACEPLWGLEYERGDCYEHDPWLAYARSHSAPARGTDIPFRTERERFVALLGKTFGFRSVVVAPTPTAGTMDRLGMLVLGSDEEGFFEAEGYSPLGLVARAVSMGLHERRAVLARQEFIAGEKLRPEELDLLRHEWQGHCSKSIAKMMGTSPGAIDARFDRLNAKLRSPNRRVSSRLAAAYGLL